MNNRPVEQALATLLPTHANDLPPELLSLALSLVAQSRSFSVSLKPEEDIARPFACAEIACKRLTRALKLPPLLGHPPCHPRMYKKLYAFLDRSLTSSTTATKRAGTRSAAGTPKQKGSVPATPTKGSTTATQTPSKAPTTTTPRGLQNTPSKSTPLKRAVNGTPKLATTTSSLSPQKRSSAPHTNGLSKSTIIPDAPAWVMTAIRTVCKTLSTPAPRTTTWSRPPISRTLPPHIFAGVSSILYFISKISSSGGDDSEVDEETLDFLEPLTSGQADEPDDDFKELVYALIVAVYFLVLARRRNPSEEEDAAVRSESRSSASATTPSFSPPGEARTMDRKTFSEMRQTALTSLGLPSNERRHREEVDQWITVIMELSWANGKEWFENIPLAGEMDGEDARLAEEGMYDEDEDDRGVTGGVRFAKRFKTGPGAILGEDGDHSKRGLLPGLGTMMQVRVDWLSEDRREDYVEWKGAVMERIQSMESAVG